MGGQTFVELPSILFIKPELKGGHFMQFCNSRLGANLQSTVESAFNFHYRWSYENQDPLLQCPFCKTFAMLTPETSHPS